MLFGLYLEFGFGCGCATATPKNTLSASWVGLCLCKSSLPRSRQHPDGLDCLARKDVEILKVSNEITRRAYALALKAMKRGIVVTLENPANSLMWHSSHHVGFMQNADGAIARNTFDMCAFGAKYKKRTAVYGSASFDFNRCVKACSKDHVHLGLSGWSVNRKKREKRMPTKQAAAYPELLCSEWAMCVRQHFLGPI